jgi:hypothetical protein
MIARREILDEISSPILMYHLENPFARDISERNAVLAKHDRFLPNSDQTTIRCTSSEIRKIE